MDDFRISIFSSNILMCSPLIHFLAKTQKIHIDFHFLDMFVTDRKIVQMEKMK